MSRPFLDLPVKEILNEYLNTPATCVSISKHFDCSEATIRKILLKHIEIKQYKALALKKKVNVNLIKNYNSRGWK